MRAKHMILILIVGAALLSGYFIYATFTNDEMQSKPEWAVLQSVEFEHRRDTTQEHLLLLKSHDYCLAGISSVNDRRIWVLLTSEHKPFYKQLPSGEYRLNSTEVKNILSFCEVHPAVTKELIARTY